MVHSGDKSGFLLNFDFLEKIFLLRAKAGRGTSFPNTVLFEVRVGV